MTNTKRWQMPLPNGASRPNAFAASKGRCKHCDGRGILGPKVGYPGTAGLPCAFCGGTGTI